jgi:hypothetical protein
MQKIFKNKGCLIGCVVGGVVFVIVVIVIVITVSKGASLLSGLNPNYGIIKTEDGTTYPCLFKPETAITKIGNQQFKFVVSGNESLDWGVLRKDNGVRRLSITGVDVGTSVDHLYMISYMPDESFIMNNLTTSYQICDKNNNTIQNSYFEDAKVNPIYSDFGDGNSTSTETEISSLFMAENPGVYRYDGLAFYNGQWILVTRMENLELY